MEKVEYLNFTGVGNNCLCKYSRFFSMCFTIDDKSLGVEPNKLGDSNYRTYFELSKKCNGGRRRSIDIVLGESEFPSNELT